MYHDDQEHNWVRADKVTEVARICFGCGFMLGIMVIPVVFILSAYGSRLWVYVGW